jgi:hypothetical protein
MEVALSKKNFTHHAAPVCMVSSSFAAMGCRPRAGNTVQATPGFRTQAMSAACAFMPLFPSAGPLLVQQLGRTQHVSFYLSRLICTPSQKQELSAQYR